MSTVLSAGRTPNDRQAAESGRARRA